MRMAMRQLRNDPELYYAYQANIAMTIMDNYHRYFPLKTSKNGDASPDPLNKDYSPTLHEWCNICAKAFLNLLIKQ